MLALPLESRHTIASILANNPSRNGISELLGSTNGVCHAQFYSSLISEGLLSPSAVAGLLDLPSAHRTDIENVLSDQLTRPITNRLSADTIERLLADAQFARVRAIQLTVVPPNPAVLLQGQGYLARVNNMLDAETRASLQTHLNHLASLHNTNPAECQAQMRQLDWLTRNLQNSPANQNLLNLLQSYPGSRLLVSAHMAGVANHIPNEQIVVFLHGATTQFVQTTIDGQGQNLSASGGNHGGRFMTTTSISTANEFGLRGAQRVGQNSYSIVGLALPSSTVNNLMHTNGADGQPLLQLQEIPDRPGQFQWVFHREAITTLQRRQPDAHRQQNGFYFRFD
jgi:hypothetical protein